MKRTLTILPLSLLSILLLTGAAGWLGAGLQLEGFISSSLPAASSCPRCLIYESTNGRLCLSDGTTWKCSEMRDAHNLAMYVRLGRPVLETLGGRRPATDGLVDSMDFTVDQAGTGTGSAILEVRQGTSTLCSLSVACTSSAGSFIHTDCVGTYTGAGGDVLLRWASTGTCSTNPGGNVVVPLRRRMP